MTEEPKMAAGPVTVNQVVRNPVMLRRRMSALLEQQEAFDSLFPPSEPRRLPSRRRKLADWWGGWLCHWRERAALRLAPWLDNYGEGL